MFNALIFHIHIYSHIPIINIYPVSRSKFNLKVKILMSLTFKYSELLIF